jgi:mono/diheme cytochrome c family protein
MAIPMSTAAYGAVVFGGLALFAIGHPAGEPPPSPTTPGLAAASTAPVTAVAAAPAQPVSAGGFTLTSTQVTLPTSDRVFPPGPGMDVAQQNCTACHSVGMVLNQPKLSAAAWDGEVHKMLSVYKAPIDPAAMPAIVAYLASIQAAR